jgi:hypothetical protein
VSQIELLAFVHGDHSRRESGVDFGTVSGGRLHVEFVLELELAEDLDGLEQRGGVVHLPLLVGESLREMLFGAASRFAVFAEALAVIVVVYLVFGCRMLSL